MAVRTVLARIRRPVAIRVLKMGRALQAHHGRDLMTITRTARGRQDPGAFLLHYNAPLVADVDDAELKKRVFHELLHALTWDLVDEVEAALRHLAVDAEAIRRELKLRAYEAREAVTYRLERTLGPLCFPELDWSEP